MGWGDGKQPIQGVIFDFDGLIIDSEGADQVAWREQFAAAGVVLPEAEYAQVWHDWAWQRRTRMIDHLRVRASQPIDQATIEADRLARYTALCQNLPARPGITDWIVDGHSSGLILGVATNDDTGRSAAHLARLGLDEYLTAVVTLRPGLRRKPAPDLYQQALTVLGLHAETTVAVEDSSHGIRAAHQAGLRVIAYPTSISAHTDLSEADLIVTDATRTTLADALSSLPELR